MSLEALSAHDSRGESRWQLNEHLSELGNGLLKPRSRFSGGMGRWQRKPASHQTQMTEGTHTTIDGPSPLARRLRLTLLMVDTIGPRSLRSPAIRLVLSVVQIRVRNRRQIQGRPHAKKPYGKHEGQRGSSQ